MRTGCLAGALVLFMLLCSCAVPKRWVVGVYYSDMGDSLRLNPNYSFRVEMMNPDSATKKQLKFTSGRWYKKRNKVHLTVAARAMGEYWQCRPLRVSWHHLRRPVECEGERGPSMDFRKVHLKKKRKRAEEGEYEKGKKRKDGISPE